MCYGAESWSDPITEDEDYCGDPPLSGWPSFPAYFYKCKSFKIYFKIVTYTEFEPEFAFESDFNEEGALRTVMNLNSVVYTILLKLQSLQSIHFVLSIQNEPTDEKARLSNDFMLSLECECLATLWRLQGLKKAKLEGFHFQDPDYVAEIEQQMLQPRSQNWSGLSKTSLVRSTEYADHSHRCRLQQRLHRFGHLKFEQKPTTIVCPCSYAPTTGEALISPLRKTLVHFRRHFTHESQGHRPSNQNVLRAGNY